MNSRFLYIAIVLSLCWSCNDNIQLNNVIKERGVVALVEAEVGSSITVSLKKSDLITQDTLSAPIQSAQVDLYKNGVLVEARRSDGNGRVKFAYSPLEKDSLLVEINGDDFDQVWTETVLPERVGIDFFDTTTHRANFQGLRLTFDDDIRTEDFYLVNLIGYRWVYEFHPVTGKKTDSIFVSEPIQMTSVNRLFFSDNNIVNNRQNFELLNDDIFNGNNFLLDVDVNQFVLRSKPGKSEILRLEVHLKHITEEYYEFLTTLSLNRPVYGGPFSISSQVPSNINGGYGIFSAFSSDTAVINFQ